MSHCISAYITKEDLLKDKTLSRVSLPQGFVLFTSHNAGNITEITIDVALISTDYFGGQGEQTAKLWLNGFQVEVKNKDTPINEVLAILGVVKEFDSDEFDSILLGNFRSNEDIEE